MKSLGPWRKRVDLTLGGGNVVVLTVALSDGETSRGKFVYEIVAEVGAAGGDRVSVGGTGDWAAERKAGVIVVNLNVNQDVLAESAASVFSAAWAYTAGGASFTVEVNATATGIVETTFYILLTIEQSEPREIT